MAQIQAALDEQRLGKNDAAIADLKKLVAAEPNDSESWMALGDTYRAADKFAEAVDAYDHAEKAIGTPSRRDWPMFYARAMAKEKLQAAGRVRSRHPDGAEAVAGTAGAAELSGL